ALFVVLSLFYLSLLGDHRDLHSFPTRRSSDLRSRGRSSAWLMWSIGPRFPGCRRRCNWPVLGLRWCGIWPSVNWPPVWRCRWMRSEEHTSELQSRFDLVCRLLLEKKKDNATYR